MKIPSQAAKYLEVIYKKTFRPIEETGGQMKSRLIQRVNLLEDKMVELDHKKKDSRNIPSQSVRKVRNKEIAELKKHVLENRAAIAKLA